MADFQPPPTYAEVVLVDPQTNKAVFNPIWLKWFVDVAAVFSSVGGGGGTVSHNSTSGLQGGQANQYYHLSQLQNASIDTDGSIRPATPAGAAQTAVHLYAGTGVPNNAQGADGDFYFRSDGAAGANNTIYKKTAGAWAALTA